LANEPVKQSGCVSSPGNTGWVVVVDRSI